MTIYKTTNIINGKFYIGKQLNDSTSYIGSGILLKKAIKKYGIENFKKEILEICSDEDHLNEREKFWIEKLNAIKNGYNIADGGSGGDTYTNNPNLDKIKIKFKGKNNPFYNKKHTKKSLELISYHNKNKIPWNKGKKGIYSNKTLKKMSRARSKFVGENASNFKKIDKNELIQKLKLLTIKKTAESFNVSIDCIRKKIKFYGIIYKNIEKIKPNKSVNYYVIDDNLFNKIINQRQKNKKTIVQLSKEFKVGINKLTNEFKKRNIKINRIK